VADLRAYFLGVWRLERILVDGRIGQGGSMEGTALFSPSGAARLLYSESGILRFGEHEGPAEQSYLYDFPEPGRAEIARHDGRPFHALDLTRGRAAVTHACGDDLYRGVYGASDPGEWWVEWQVSGPRKDQRITTRYRRL
jgi:hypothetical protein